MANSPKYMCHVSVRYISFVYTCLLFCTLCSLFIFHVPRKFLGTLTFPLWILCLCWLLLLHGRSNSGLPGREMCVTTPPLAWYVPRKSVDFVSYLLVSSWWWSTGFRRVVFFPFCSLPFCSLPSALQVAEVLFQNVLFFMA